MTNVCFVDTETTGLDPDRHEIWEVGLILPDGSEKEWQLPVDLGRADPMALAIGRFHERRWTDDHESLSKHLSYPHEFASDFVRLTRGLHLCGANVRFDAERLWKLLREQGECPMWHYHLVDVRDLVIGYVQGFARGIARTALSVEQSNLLREAGGGSVPNVGQFRGALELRGVNPSWKSRDLWVSVGVNPDLFELHTALGDARLAKAVYEKVMGS